jgi:hypothetical protein
LPGQLIQLRGEHVPILTGTCIKGGTSGKKLIKGSCVIHHFRQVTGRLSPLAVALPESSQSSF